MKKPDTVSIALALDLLIPYRLVNDPVDLNRVAKDFGAVDIQYTAQRTHGFTNWSARGPVVRLAMSKSDGRRRFTLAHECGHLLIDRMPVTTGELEANTSDKPNPEIDGISPELRAGLTALVEKYGKEEVCDQVARELLLPARMMPGTVEKVRDLSDLTALSQKHRVSLAMLVARINQMGGHFCFMRFERGVNNSWFLVHRIGSPRGWEGNISLNSTTGSSIERLEHGECSTLPLRLASTFQSTTVSGEVRRSGECYAIALIRASSFNESNVHDEILFSGSPRRRNPNLAGSAAIGSHSVAKFGKSIRPN